MIEREKKLKIVRELITLLDDDELHRTFIPEPILLGTFVEVMDTVYYSLHDYLDSKKKILDQEAGE